jgi:hypothetical protein
MLPRAESGSLPSDSSRPHGAVGAFGSPPAPTLMRPIMPNSCASFSAA